MSYHLYLDKGNGNKKNKKRNRDIININIEPKHQASILGNRKRNAICRWLYRLIYRELNKHEYKYEHNGRLPKNGNQNCNNAYAQ